MKIQALHESSMIQSSVYDTEIGKLIVTFNGGASYAYDAVTEEDYQLFSNAESIGNAFNLHIRKYNGEKLLIEVSDDDLRNEFPANVEGSMEFNQANQLNESSTN